MPKHYCLLDIFACLLIGLCLLCIVTAVLMVNKDEHKMVPTRCYLTSRGTLCICRGLLICL